MEDERDRHPSRSPLGVATQFVLIPLYEVIFLFFGEQDVSGPARSLVASVDSPLDLLGLLVITVNVAPLTEEIAYRGLLGIRDMERGHVGSGVVIAAAVSSVIFAASHFQLIQFGFIRVRPRCGGGLPSHWAAATASGLTSASTSPQSCCCSG